MSQVSTLLQIDSCNNERLLQENEPMLKSILVLIKDQQEFTIGHHISSHRLMGNLF